MKHIENLHNSDEGPFFFEDQRKIGEKDTSVSTMTFFFLGGHIETGQKDEKIFGIITLSLERLHYFQHFRRR